MGHSEHEVERLKGQARLIDPITKRFFLAAGIGPGMRVLDVGSGAGDVSFLAADIAGAGGAEAMRLQGTETRMGSRLHAAFIAAGLPAPTLRLEALVVAE